VFVNSAPALGVQVTARAVRTLGQHKTAVMSVFKGHGRQIPPGSFLPG
jgi:hypothetical protein